MDERWAWAHLFLFQRRSNTKPNLKAVEDLARELAAALGLEVVSFVFHSQGRHSQLRIDLDRSGPVGVDLGDCERLSRALDERLDGSGLLDTTYELQVSSPGIDRPIRTPDDFRRNAGRRVWMQFRDDEGRVLERRGNLVWDADSGRVGVVDGASETQVPADRIILMKQCVRSPEQKRPRR